MGDLKFGMEARILIRRNGEEDAIGVTASVPWWSFTKTVLAAAALALIDLMADRLQLAPGQRVCDIGCGYGGARTLYCGGIRLGCGVRLIV